MPSWLMVFARSTSFSTLSVHRQRNRPLVPVHAPDVEGARPRRVEGRDRRARVVPDRPAALRAAPRGVGEQHAAVVLHDVDLAVVRPRRRRRRASRRPATAPARVSMRARISKRPYCQLWRPRVMRLAEVYSGGLRRLRGASRVARWRRSPGSAPARGAPRSSSRPPATRAFSGVYHCSSWLRTKPRS